MEDFSTFVSYLKNHDNFKGTVSENEPLAQKSTFKIGGRARVFVAPDDYYSFQLALRQLVKEKIPFYIVGGASNLVFPDGNYNGVILSSHNFSDSMIFPKGDLPEDFGKTEFQRDQVLVTCFSGTPTTAFVNFCTKNDLSGAEEFAGLPGTVGGAVYMNARCFEKSISEILYYYTWMDYSLPEIPLFHERVNSSDWDYKKSPFQGKKKFIATVTFLLTRKHGNETPQIAKKCREFTIRRIEKGHFKYPSAGSVFKNNHEFGSPSGKLIDECGLKGSQIGGAQIAPFHGNFIINIDSATSADVKALVELAKSSVKEKFGFELENEIIFLENQPDF